MTFGEMILACDVADAEFNSEFSKCKAFADASYNLYKVNLKEAGLQVMEESGTSDELVCLEKEASDGFLVKAAKTIERMVKAFIKFVTDKVKAMKQFFADKKVKNVLDKADKVIRENPKLKKKKVKIKDYKKEISALDKVKSKIDRKMAVFKSKRFKESDKAELDAIEDEVLSIKTAEKAVAITVSLTLLSAMAWKFYNEFVKEADNAAEMESLPPSITLTENPEDMETYIQATQIKTEIEKERLNTLQKAATSIINFLRRELTGVGEANVDLNVEESTEDLVEESVDIPESYESMDSSKQEEYINDILESFEEDDEMTPEEYLETLESTIFNNEEVQQMTAEEYLEAIEYELFDDDDLLEESYYDDDSMTADEYLEAMEYELFDDDDSLTAEEYLEAMEYELFDDDDLLEESYYDDDRLDEMLDDIIDSI